MSAPAILAGTITIPAENAPAPPVAAAAERHCAQPPFLDLGADPVLLAAMLTLVFARRRRGYVEHLVFAAHVAAFNLALGLVAMAVQPLAETMPAIGVPLMTALILAVMWFYLWRAVERVYGDAGWAGGVRAAVLVLGFSIAQSIGSLLSLVTPTLSLLYQVA